MICVKVSPDPPRFARPCYYTTSVPICQEVFQNFFKSFFHLPSLSAEVPEYYTTFQTLCQEVFQKFFQKTFSWSLPDACPRFPFGQLAYYSTFGFLCQGGFRIFFEFGQSLCFEQKFGQDGCAPCPKHQVCLLFSAFVLLSAMIQMTTARAKTAPK